MAHSRVNTFQPSRYPNPAGTAGAGGIKPPSSTRISVRLKHVGNRSNVTCSTRDAAFQVLIVGELIKLLTAATVTMQEPVPGTKGALKRCLV